MAVAWESISEGEQLPELRKRPDVPQLVKYAAGSGDFNPLHYDYSFPQAKQIGSIIVHGRFKYAALGELVSNWLLPVSGHGHAASGHRLPRHRFTQMGRERREAGRADDLEREPGRQEDDPRQGRRGAALTDDQGLRTKD